MTKTDCQIFPHIYFVVACQSFLMIQIFVCLILVWEDCSVSSLVTSTTGLCCPHRIRDSSPRTGFRDCSSDLDSPDTRGHDSGQSIVVLPPQFQGRLHVPISSREFLLELEHNVGEVLVHDGGVGGSLVSGQPQLDLPDFEHVAGQVLSARPLLPTGKIQE